jgi:hypothetical protein
LTFSESDVEATKMYDKFSPYVYPVADEDLERYADNSDVDNDGPEI